MIGTTTTTVIATTTVVDPPRSKIIRRPAHLAGGEFCGQLRIGAHRRSTACPQGPPSAPPAPSVRSRTSGGAQLSEAKRGLEFRLYLPSWNDTRTGHFSSNWIATNRGFGMAA